MSSSIDLMFTRHLDDALGPSEGEGDLGPKDLGKNNQASSQCGCLGQPMHHLGEVRRGICQATIHLDAGNFPGTHRPPSSDFPSMLLCEGNDFRYAGDYHGRERDSGGDVDDCLSGQIAVSWIRLALLEESCGL